MQSTNVNATKEKLLSTQRNSGATFLIKVIFDDIIPVINSESDSDDNGRL